MLTGAYLAAVFLAGDSVRAGQPDLARAFRARALGAARRRPASSRSAACSSCARTRAALFDGLTSGGGLAMVLVSGASRASPRSAWSSPSATASPAVVRRARSPRSSVGWALAQNPYVLPPQLTLDRPRPRRRDPVALLIGMAVGALILVPSLWYLYRLVLQGRLDQEFEPLHQRFVPIPDDEPEARA